MFGIFYFYNNDKENHLKSLPSHPSTANSQPARLLKAQEIGAKSANCGVLEQLHREHEVPPFTFLRNLSHKLKEPIKYLNGQCLVYKSQFSYLQAAKDYILYLSTIAGLVYCLNYQICTDKD